MMRATKTLKGVFLSAWGRGKATLLTVMVALTLATVTPAFAANGGNFILGSLNNTATAITRLSSNMAGPALQIINNNAAANATALNLATRADRPPMRVNSATKVTNLNADKLDGLDSSQLKASCPAGTQSLSGACIDNAVRGTDDLLAASSTCAGFGLRLPTSAELDAFRQRPNVTIGSGGSAEWSGSIVVNVGTGALAMTDAGVYSEPDRIQNLPFRCVFPPS
jgi:hypothetical protein